LQKQTAGKWSRQAFRLVIFLTAASAPCASRPSSFRTGANLKTQAAWLHLFVD
jgi:hypothetical protein